MNKVILMGRLTHNVELKAVNDTNTVKFTVAVNRRYQKDKADFINCVAFGKTAEFITKYFGKGRMIAGVGNLQINSYKDKDGNNKYATNVVIDEVYFTGESKDSKTNTTSDDEWTGIDVDNDKLPF